MMDRVAACLVAVCITLTGSTNLIAQDTPQNDLFESMLMQESSQKLSPNEISEIVAIRNRLGGGTGLDLGNILDDLPFLTEKNPVQYFEPMNDEQHFKPVVTAEKLFWEMLDSSRTALPAQTSFPASAPKSEIESLRTIARRLEELAADMEELNLFEGADGLRIQAANVRQQSRLQLRSASHQENTIR